MSEFTVDLNKIINIHVSWPVNKALATKLALQSYTSVGAFLQGLSDSELSFICKQIDATNNEDEAAAELFLLTVLLSIGEGLEVDEEEMVKRYDHLIGFVTCEALHRAGLAEVIYENMSFSSDMGNATIIKSNDQGLKVISDILKDSQ